MSIGEVFSLLGGVGLFLLGMSLMSSGLKNACGDNLQGILEKATKNKLIAVLVGIGMTMLIQSSSATDVMVIGFVSSGMMNLFQAIGVIMGANIGTTITAQLTAFQLSTFTPFLLCLGAIMFLFLKKNLLKHVGSVIMGFGMLFQGITIMKAAVAPLSQSAEFVEFMSRLSNPALAFVFGIVFTALLQSSSSSIVIFQTFAVQGLLTYDMTVYLVIGAAVGSVTPNLLASLTATRNGKRTAILNLLFNVIRAGILLILINAFPVLLSLIQNLSPGNIGRQIANTHTIFAIVAVLIEFAFTKQIIALAYRFIPLLPEENRAMEDRTLMYMNQIDKVTPAIALREAQMEITRMGRIATENLNMSIQCFFSYDEEKASLVREREETVNILNHMIADAMVALRMLSLTETNMRRVSMMTIAVTDIERISDHAENIVEYAEQLKNKRAKMSEDATQELYAMALDAIAAVDLSIYIFSTEDYTQLELIEELESRIDDQQKMLINNHVERLMYSHCDPLAGVIFSDLVTDLERCSDHAINLAYALKERANQII